VLELSGVDGELVRDTFDAARVTLELLSAITPGGEGVEESGVELERGLRSKTGLDETSLTRTDQNRTGFGRELGHALVNGKRRAAGLVDVDPKQSFGGREDAAGRRVDAISGGRGICDAEEEASVPQPEERFPTRGLGERGEVHLRALVHLQHGTVGKKNLGAPTGGGPKTIPGHHGNVDGGFSSFRFQSPLERGPALGVAYVRVVVRPTALAE
jgi:hypothetical protein